MKPIIGLAILLTICIISPCIATVSQDYQEDNVVKVPINGSTCHRIWLDGTINKYTSAGLEILQMPSFVHVFVNGSPANMSGIYQILNGIRSDAIVFRIIPTQDMAIGSKWNVSFKVIYPESKTSNEQIIIIPNSGFTIQIVNSSYTTKDRCGSLPSDIQAINEFSNISLVIKNTSMSHDTQILNLKQASLVTIPESNEDISAVISIIFLVSLIFLIIILIKKYKNNV